MRKTKAHPLQAQLQNYFTDSIKAKGIGYTIKIRYVDCDPYLLYIKTALFNLFHLSSDYKRNISDDNQVILLVDLTHIYSFAISHISDGKAS